MSEVVVHRVIVDLHGVPRGSGHAWHERVSRWARQRLPVLLEQALARHTGGDHLVIPTLELDLGHQSPVELEGALELALADSVELGVQAADAPAPRSDGSRALEPHRLSPTERAFGLILTFATSGLASESAPRGWSVQQEVQALVQREPEAMLRLLVELASSSRALFRLCLQLDRPRQRLLLELVESGHRSSLPDARHARAELVEQRIRLALGPRSEQSKRDPSVGAPPETSPGVGESSRGSTPTSDGAPRTQERHDPGAIGEQRPETRDDGEAARRSPASISPRHSENPQSTTDHAPGHHHPDSPNVAFPASPEAMRERPEQAPSHEPSQLEPTVPITASPRPTSQTSPPPGPAVIAPTPRPTSQTSPSPETVVSNRPSPPTTPETVVLPGRSLPLDRALDPAPETRQHPERALPDDSSLASASETSAPPNSPPPRGRSLDSAPEGTGRAERARGPAPETSVRPEPMPSTSGRLSSPLAHRVRNASRPSTIEQELPDSVEAPQAGLVLLWPLLPAFLRAVDLLVDGVMTEEARERAVFLLHHAATLQARAEEHELMLPKLLCGCDPSRPIGPGIELAPREARATEELLDSVIEHWSALGTLSRDGFRSSFLHRPGRLFLQQPPILRIERRGYDVLLDRLPYPISTIKLSWMRTVLHTELCP